MSDVAWGLVPVWFALGLVLGVVVLLLSPRLYERLRQCIAAARRLFMETCCGPARCWRPSDMDNPVYNPGPSQATGAEHVTNHNYDYSEIDMKKTQTFQPSNTSQKPRQRYEECVIDRNSHTYSKCSGELPPETEAGANRISDLHTYSILEPGSNKRLPVRIVTEDLRDDPGHVYFKLEPGTNKLTPQMTLDRVDMKDHTYFVLEAPTGGDAGVEEGNEENAYCVNELSEHNYFILEKE